MCHFPRLLVTAHSNAAVEQLQQRARAGCFVDQNGGTLGKPGELRVVSEVLSHHFFAVELPVLVAEAAMNPFTAD